MLNDGRGRGEVMEPSRSKMEASRILEVSRGVMETSRGIMEASRGILEAASRTTIPEQEKLTRGLSDSDARSLMYYAEEDSTRCTGSPQHPRSEGSPQHPRSSSYSQLASYKEKAVNLNNSFPCYESLAPYISSSVTIPANLQQGAAKVIGASSISVMHNQASSVMNQASSSSVLQNQAGPLDDQGFYQNVSGRIRQSELPLQEKGRFAGRASARNSQELSRNSRISTDLDRNSRISTDLDRNSRISTDLDRNSRISTDGSKHFDLHKSPRTQELEEFAARFDGYQMQRSRRLVHPTPMLDQLTRDWLPAADPAQLTSLETSLLKLVQRNDSINNRSGGARHFLVNNCASDDNSSGRESVTTVVSNSSSETLKYNEHTASDRIPSDFGEVPSSRGCDFGDNVGIPPRGSFQELVRDQHNLNCDQLRAVRDSSPANNDQYHYESQEPAGSNNGFAQQHGSLSRRTSYKVSGDGGASGILEQPPGDEISQSENLIQSKSPLAAMEEEQSRKLHISLTASWSLQNKATRYSTNILETDLDNVDLDTIWRDKERKNRHYNRLMNEARDNEKHCKGGQEQLGHVMVSGGPNQSWWQENCQGDLPPPISQRDRRRNGTSSSQASHSRQQLEELLYHRDSRDSRDSRCNSQMSDDSLERSYSQISNIERSASQLSNIERNASQLSNIERNASQLSNIERSASQLSNIERSASQISNIERSASQISNIERSASQLSNDHFLQLSNDQFQPSNDQFLHSSSQLSKEQFLQRLSRGVPEELVLLGRANDELLLQRRSFSQLSDEFVLSEHGQDTRHSQDTRHIQDARHNQDTRHTQDARHIQDVRNNQDTRHTQDARLSKQNSSLFPCTFCLVIHSDKEEKCLSARRYINNPEDLAYKNTYPRRNSRRRKPKLPTPPRSPTTRESVSDCRVSTPEPPPPPPPVVQDHIAHNDDPLPPPPSLPPPLSPIHQKDMRQQQHSPGDRKNNNQLKEGLTRQLSGHPKETVSRQLSGQKEKETIRRQLSGQEKEVARRNNSGQLQGKEEHRKQQQQGDVRVSSRQRSYSLSRQNEDCSVANNGDVTGRTARQRGDILPRHQNDTQNTFAKQKVDGLTRQDTLSRHEGRNDTLSRRDSRNDTLSRHDGRNDTLSRHDGRNDTLNRHDTVGRNNTLGRQEGHGRRNDTLSRQTSNTPHRQPAASPPPPRQLAVTPPPRQPAATPKRDSPATIAAKEAPGWQMFLGVKSSTVSFTTEEVSKFRAARDESRGRRKADRGNRWESQQQGGRPEGRQQGGSKAEERSGRSESRQRSDGKTQRSSPVDDKQQSLHLSRERSLKSISNWWKNSLESGPPPPAPGEENSSFVWRESAPAHNHSHSDSGISSLSGRSSCMSPMSVLSSSSGSSRTSLRSSSIVSASNIILDEDQAVDQETEFVDLCRRVASTAPKQSRIPSIVRTSLNGSLQVYFPEGSLEFEIISSGKENCETLSPETPKRGRPNNFEDCRKSLLHIAAPRLEEQRRHLQILKEATRANEDSGKSVMERLGKVAAQAEMDKVKLFTEEVDKITSLLIGLCGRLNKVNRDVNASHKTDGEAQRSHLERREKLEEQVEEATKLRQSIFKRGEAVFVILAKYLQAEQINAFGAFIRCKIRLIVDIRQHGEVIKAEEELLKCLKESVI